MSSATVSVDKRVALVDELTEARAALAALPQPVINVTGPSSLNGAVIGGVPSPYATPDADEADLDATELARVAQERADALLVARARIEQAERALGAHDATVNVGDLAAQQAKAVQARDTAGRQVRGLLAKAVEHAAAAQEALRSALALEENVYRPAQMQVNTNAQLLGDDYQGYLLQDAPAARALTNGMDSILNWKGPTR